MQTLRLASFPSVSGLPNNEAEIARTLRSKHLGGITCCALGPTGTNIEQAARTWIQRMKIAGKANILLCNKPEESVVLARELESPKLGIFWTCAVYVNEYRIFFENPDTLPFMFQQVMPLDSMQLAVPEEMWEREFVRAYDLARFGSLSPDMRVASHPSPAPLLRDTVKAANIITTRSNSHAAELCARQEVEACLTTASAARLHKLKTLHVFGSPPMVFFGGITANGAVLMAEAHRHLTKRRRKGHA